MASFSSVYAVCNTFELLEQILLFASLQDLLVHQRVSRTWRDVIQRSEPIRKKQFLLPRRRLLKPIEHFSDIVTFPSCPLKLNPIISVERLDSSKQRNYGKHRHITPRKASLVSAIVSGSNHVLEVAHSLHFDKHLKLRPRLTDSSNTWRSTFLTQPPITAINLEVAGVEGLPDGTQLTTIYSPTGLTLGYLYDSICKVKAASRPDKASLYAIDEMSFRLKFQVEYSTSRDDLRDALKACGAVKGPDGICDCLRFLWKE